MEQFFHAVLTDGDFSKLEELAQNAGYTTRFDVMDTRLMRAPQLRHAFPEGPQATRAAFDSSTLYLCMPDERKMRGAFLSGLFDKLNINVAEDSPRTDWNRRYRNHFTRLRESDSGTEFVDCWTPKVGCGKDRAQLVTGRFALRHYFPQFPPYANADEETRRVLHLAQLRQAAPPYSPLEILTGPTPGFIAKRVFMDASAGFIGLMFGTMSSIFAEGHPSQLTMGLYSGAFILAAEALQYSTTSIAFGNRYFRGKGARYGRDAVDALVRACGAPAGNPG